ncbi:MAG TPA: recombinase family protein, partial [Candidatus Ligilactobacillus excrementavium]|nr:recombinase family protein [Candidatus Ligilactobacillus excrementavium]
MKYGYIRVSLCGPSKTEQEEQLLASGVVKSNIFYDRIDSYSTQTDEFTNLLEKLRAKDILVITTLDRIAQSTK